MLKIGVKVRLTGSIHGVNGAGQEPIGSIATIEIIDGASVHVRFASGVRWWVSIGDNAELYDPPNGLVLKPKRKMTLC